MTRQAWLLTDFLIKSSFIAFILSPLFALYGFYSQHQQLDYTISDSVLCESAKTSENDFNSATHVAFQLLIQNYYTVH